MTIKDVMKAMICKKKLVKSLRIIYKGTKEINEKNSDLYCGRCYYHKLCWAHNYKVEVKK